MKRTFATIVSFFVFAMLAAPAPSQAGGSMKAAAVSFPLPKNSDPIPLSTLTYGGIGGFVEITSVRLEIASEEGEDPIRAVWTVTGRNGKPQTRRVQVSISLLNAAKKRLACAKKTVFLKSSTPHKEFKIKMKVKAKKWTQAKTVYIRVDFLNM